MCFVILILAISNCSGANVFEILKSSYKCATESEPKVCMLNKIREFCTDKAGSSSEQEHVQGVCACQNETSRFIF